jgi:serine/threonine protein phosphatase PrpC
VKGRLQPTRSFGDFYLKVEEFNGPPGRAVRTKYTPPYITAEPEVTVVDISSEIKAKKNVVLILASDGWFASSLLTAPGLYDEMSNESIAQRAYWALSRGENPSEYIANEAIKKVHAGLSKVFSSRELIGGSRTIWQRKSREDHSADSCKEHP